MINYNNQTTGEFMGRALGYDYVRVGNVIKIERKQEDVFPHDWITTGIPTDYELCASIKTCKKYIKMNEEALLHPDCNKEKTKENLLRLKKLYIILMDYLIED